MVLNDAAAGAAVRVCGVTRAGRLGWGDNFRSGWDNLVGFHVKLLGEDAGFIALRGDWRRVRRR